MKQLRLALLLAAPFALSALHAQEEQQQQARPPTEIPDFSNLDEFIYEPKSIMTLGMRRISGAKTSFSGQGKIVAPETLLDPATVATTSRAYHDGFVGLNARTTSVDNGDGAVVTQPLPSDGKTNTWNIVDSSQINSDGFAAFHVYSAQVTDTDVHSKKGAAAFGMELAVAYDMGKIGKTKLGWTLFGGMSINDINNSTSANVRANVTTVTDYYDLFGQTVPSGSYTAPSTSTVTLTNADGTTTDTTIDSTILLGDHPLGRTTATASSATSVRNRWKVRGAYYTFRAGASVIMPLWKNFKVSLSAGPAFIYSGTTYSVVETFSPDTGTQITDSGDDIITRGLPGYFVDANLLYDITDRAGLYLGGSFQSAGSYNQTINTDNASYSTKIDLTKQTGMSAGMTYRF